MNHTCTLNQLKRISGGRPGFSVTMKCRGCGKTLVLKPGHALYASWQRWRDGTMTRGMSPDTPEETKG